VQPAPIRTPRLDLISMTPAFLEASLRGELEHAATLLGSALDPGWPEDPSLLEIRLTDLEVDSDFAPWSLRAISLRDEQRMIGHAGFHARPGSEHLAEIAPDAVEFGYRIYPAERRRGYAREACQGLMSWALTQPGVRRFVLSIAPDNRPSIALARQLGFERTGSSHVDPLDGPEDIFLLEGS
jgi:RimJ/RimL family protein N-acetyltransferase